MIAQLTASEPTEASLDPSRLQCVLTHRLHRVVLVRCFWKGLLHPGRVRGAKRCADSPGGGSDLRLQPVAEGAYAASQNHHTSLLKQPVNPTFDPSCLRERCGHTAWLLLTCRRGRRPAPCCSTHATQAAECTHARRAVGSVKGSFVRSNDAGLGKTNRCGNRRRFACAGRQQRAGGVRSHSHGARRRRRRRLIHHIPR